MRPAGDGTRAGYFNLNTYNLRSRPLYTLEALSLHEAVPGHHLQLALQQELAGLPHVRRYSDYTAFIEGWALYAERLGLEAGFYEDPYSNFGRLTMEICALDGWSSIPASTIRTGRVGRPSNTCETTPRSVCTILKPRSIVTSAGRGKPLAYKMGELKIRELRSSAEERLGPQFDLRHSTT